MCLNHQSESGCVYGDKCYFLPTQAFWAAQQKSKEGAAQGSAALVPRESRICAIMKNRKKKSGAEGSIAGNQSEVRTCRSEIHGGPIIKFEERTQDESLKQEWCARRDAGELAEDVCELKVWSKKTFYSLAEAWVMRAHSSINPEERFLWSTVKLQCISHVRRTSAQERRNSHEIQIRHDSGDIH